LLDYFALAENVRGRGFGTEFIRSVIEGLDLYSNNQLLFLEVEDPKYGDNYSERCRRINFYKRLGVNIIKDVHYILPPLSGDDPTDMVIMVYPKPQENQFSSDLCRSLIVDLYINKYHRDMDDIFLKNSLQSIPQRIEYE
jgi:hypothetical protein